MATERDHPGPRRLLDGAEQDRPRRFANAGGGGAPSACADHFEEETRAAAARLTVEARVLRALALGQCDVEIYAAATGMTTAQASAALRARRAAARKAAGRGARR